MRSKKNSGSLFGLLAGNYLLFTLTLFLIAGGVYVLWNTQMDRLYLPVDWESLLEDDALRRGSYDALTGYIRGEGNAFAVLDGEGKRLYRSDEDFELQLSRSELECVPVYGDPSFLESVSYEDSGGRRWLLVTRYAYDDSGAYGETASMTLDEDYRVVSGGLGDGRDGYTRREYQLLTGAAVSGAALYRYSYADAAGNERTLLMQTANFNEESFYSGYRAVWRIWLLFVPLYLLAAGLFIWWLNRRIQLPLEKLNAAVVAQAEGQAVHVGDCGGTSEIQRIGESFDRLSQRLAKSEQERRALDEGRQKLIADISHDLKTPITVISGYAGAICDGKVPPEEERRYLRAIQLKAETLAELINAFHEYSKVEHPEFTLHLERTDLCEFSREYLAKKYDEIDLAGFALEVSIPEEPLLCELDEFQFRRALDNILSNSIRYNRLGTVLFFEVLAGPAMLLVKIADNGIGIPPERRGTIFEPFVVGSDARSGGGSGLGLAITKRIVERHGGIITLSLKPEEGRSSEFVIRLPRVRPQA